MQDAVLFDLDGTLVDSLEDIAEALDRAFDDHGLTRPPRTSLRGWVGGGARHLVEQAVSAPLVDGILARFQHHYAAAPADHTVLYPGIGAVLDALVERGVRLAVISNKPHDLTVAIAAQRLAAWPFAAIVGHRPGTPLKPDPTAALALALALDVPPARCTLVGDAPSDVATARAAGMRALAVSWGFRPRASLVGAQPDGIADHAAELLALLTR